MHETNWKPEPHRKVKARRKRAEAKQVKAVRPQVAARDGYCRLAGAGLGACSGASEWAHCTTHRRSKTMKQAPERRHSTAGSFMACSHHHHRIDRNEQPFITDRPLTERGADGPMEFASEDGSTYTESGA